MEYLMHYGVKGQKHGVRKYQNEDGTLTEEGRRHYGYGMDKKVRILDPTKKPNTKPKEITAEERRKIKEATDKIKGMTPEERRNAFNGNAKSSTRTYSKESKAKGKNILANLFGQRTEVAKSKNALEKQKNKTTELENERSKAETARRKRELEMKRKEDAAKAEERQRKLDAQKKQEKADAEARMRRLELKRAKFETKQKELEYKRAKEDYKADKRREKFDFKVDRQDAKNTLRGDKAESKALASRYHDQKKVNATKAKIGKIGIIVGGTAAIIAGSRLIKAFGKYGSRKLNP